MADEYEYADSISHAFRRTAVSGYYVDEEALIVA